MSHGPAQDADARLMAGVDLGGTFCHAGVVDGRGRVLGRAHAETDAERGADAVIARIADLVRAACDDAARPPSDLAGVGVGAPGAIDHDRGVVLEAPNLRWAGVPLRDELSARLGQARVRVENDVNAAVLGECRFGAGEGAPDVLGVWLGTGVGGGLVLNGGLWRGPLGTAGEIGQTILLPRDVLGRRRLEETCSRAAVGRRLAELIRSNHRSSIPELLGPQGDLDAISAGVVGAAYAAGDPLTRAVVDESADLLAAGVANVLSVLAVPLVILGGGLTEAIGEPLVRRVEARVRAEAFPAGNDAIRCVATRLREDAGLLGAASAAFDHIA